MKDEPAFPIALLEELHGLLERALHELKLDSPWGDSAESKRIAALIFDTQKRADALIAELESKERG